MQSNKEPGACVNRPGPWLNLSERSNDMDATTPTPPVTLWDRCLIQVPGVWQCWEDPVEGWPWPICARHVLSIYRRAQAEIDWAYTASPVQADRVLAFTPCPDVVTTCASLISSRSGT